MVAGGGDAGTHGADGASPLPCGGGCTTGTTCTEFGWCKIDVAPTCATPIEVTAAGGRFKGTLCADGGTAMLCGTTMPAHVFAMGPADAGFAVVLGPDRGVGFGTNVVDSSCHEASGSGGVRLDRRRRRRRRVLRLRRDVHAEVSPAVRWPLESLRWTGRLI